MTTETSKSPTKDTKAAATTETESKKQQDSKLTDEALNKVTGGTAYGPGWHKP